MWHKSEFKKLGRKIKQNKWEVALLSLILCIGIFVRTYHFSDWLHFEIDQTYDTNIVSAAVEQGISHLPLLGPTAGGGRSLRLGPAFYYMEYVSAKIFGDNPVGHAMNVLLLNIAAIPLFYLLCKRYFSKNVSLGLTAILAVSFYSIVYSRFSWSPNVLPFLTIATFYAFLRSTDAAEQKKNLWFLIAVAFLTITSQIHFNAFFVMPAVFGSYLIYKRPRFSWKTWLAAVGIVIFLYSPVIFNDIKTGGENSQLFIDKLTKVQSSKKNKQLKSFAQDLQYDAAEYFFITSADGVISSKMPNSYSLEGINPNPLWYWGGLAFLFAALAILLWNIWQEKSDAKKDFLIISFLWFFWSTLYFYSLVNGYRVYPRFYLLISPLAIIFAGFVLEKIKPEKNRKYLAAFVVVIAALMLSNLIKVNAYFDQYRQNALVPPIPMGDVFPDTHRIRLEDQVAASDYIASEVKKNNYPVFIQAQAEIEPSFWYHLNARGINYVADFNSRAAYANANYFFINSYPADVAENFDIIKKEKFGTFLVVTAAPKHRIVIADSPSAADYKQRLQMIQISELVTWSKLSSPLTINKGPIDDNSPDNE